MDPITYPARPSNGGPLEYAFEAAAYPHPGRWVMQPKYNGWRALVHLPSGRMWNRHGKPLTIHAEFEEAVSILRETGFEWLDCEALARRHAQDQGKLIILDWVVADYPYRLRRYMLETLIPKEDARFELVPNLPLSLEAYRDLQRTNHELGVTYYEGVVTKEIDSHYNIQLRDPSSETLLWVKHRFTNQ